MANYNVDIGVKVRGEELKKFGEQLKETQKQVNGVNRFLDTFRKENIRVNESISNLNGQLIQAKATFREATIGTKQQVQAAKDLLVANENLNKGLTQQQQLLDNLSGATAKKTAADNEKLQAGLLKLERQSTRELEEQFQLRQTGQEQLKQKVSEINQQRREENKLLKENVIKTKQSVAAEIKKRFSIMASAKQRRTDLIQANRQVQTEIKINKILEARRRTQAASGGRTRGNVASSAIIGGAFPLLFGQTGAAAVGGGLGGLAGGAIGGQFGFALSILGTVIGSAIDKNDKFNQSLAALNVQFTNVSGGVQLTAKDIDAVASRLRITKEEAFEVLGAFSQFGSGSIAKSLTEIFGSDAGAFGGIAGASRQAQLANQIFEARQKIGVERAIELQRQNLSNKAGVIELALAEARAQAENDIAVAQAKQIKFSDRAKTFAEEYLLGTGGMDASRYGQNRADKLNKEFEENRKQRLENFTKALEKYRELLGLTNEAQGQFGQSGTLAFSAIEDKVKDLQDEMKALQDPIRQAIALSDTIGASFEDSFKGIIKGTMSVADAFKNMFNRIADHFLDMTAQMMANQFRQGLLGLFTNFLTPNPYGVKPGQSLYDVKTPSRFTDMTVGVRANGGPVTGGKPYIVGERGPELFSPGVSGTITPNHALGGSTNVVVNVDAKGNRQVEGDDNNATMLGNAIAVAVQQELVKQQMDGGLLS